MSVKLTVVIHAEEEFDWNGGFHRANTKVSHGNELIELMGELLALDATIVLAMDYPFVMSQDGEKVIAFCNPYAPDKIEYAAHLHPWVNPPFDDDAPSITNHDSFPGNLDKNSETQKLRVLTNAITKKTGIRPITYLAGRYGIGANTADILKALGYKIDLSISAYSNFSHVEGPNFAHYSNQIHAKHGLTYIPHTCAMVGFCRAMDDYLNKHPQTIAKAQQHNSYQLLSRLFRIHKYRLSPEGFSLAEMQRLTQSQLRIGQKAFILSFHSPSAKLGGTPYVTNKRALHAFKQGLIDYIRWFNQLENSTSFLPNQAYGGSH